MTHTPFALACPSCRTSDLIEVSHYPLDSDTPAEVYFWCMTCGYEEVYTPHQPAVMLDDDADTEKFTSLKDAQS